jgi:GNAT superfamily N-acetyltransferase
MTLPGTFPKCKIPEGQRKLKIALRTASSQDSVFARDLYFETMRGMIERFFGWDQPREERNFAAFFKVDEVRIITADDRDVGWIQEQVENRMINLGSFYVMPAMQGRGIGTKVLNILLARAADQSKAITLAVVKINPARYFYEKRGFRITHEDHHKFYMRADPGGPRMDN